MEILPKHSMLNKSQNEIMAKWPNDWETPLVSIRCITYNHEAFIAQALNGFLMQVTEFPFEIVVHDDASTDKTADIIREYEAKYPRIIKALYEKENQYSKHDGSLGRIMDAECKGKYLAFCEGDDYWIDAYKIQKQISFLEEHPEYGFSYTNAKGFDQSKNSFYDMKVKGFSGMLYDFEIKCDIDIWTLTFLCRKDLYLSRPKLDPHKFFCGDRLAFFYISRHSKGFYLPEITSVYRKQKNSASHFTSRSKKARFSFFIYHTNLYFLEKYPPNTEADIFKKQYSFRMIPYCIWYHDRDAFNEISISFHPFLFRTKKETIKYMIKFFIYKLLKIKILFDLSSFICSIIEKK